MDAGQIAMAIAHLNLWLRWAKKASKIGANLTNIRSLKGTCESGR